MLRFEVISDAEIDQRLLLQLTEGNGAQTVSGVPNTYLDVFPRISVPEHLALRGQTDIADKLRWDGRPTHSRFTFTGKLGQEAVDYATRLGAALIPHRNVWLAHLVVHRKGAEAESLWIPPRQEDLLAA